MDLNQDYYPVLSRVVMASARHDPQLRQRIYDLARSKLRRRLDWEVYELSAGERAQKMQALEAAIEQIEADLGNGYRHSRPQATVAAPDSEPLVEIIPPGQYIPLPPPEPQPQTENRPSAPIRGSTYRSAALLVAAALLGVAGYAAVQRGIGDQPAPVASAADRSMATGALAKPSPAAPIPEAYGVYAITDGKLSELTPLSIRVPAQGVPISAAFADASKTRLPSGRVQFIAFRRDLAGNVPDRVVVRVIARIVRPPALRRGQSSPTEGVSDGWVVRNLSYEMKVGPVEGRPAMIVMRPADADLSLPAGRYALVLKGAAYDFTVDGQVTDLAQCVTRGDEVDAPVYAPCRSRP